MKLIGISGSLRTGSYNTSLLRSFGAALPEGTELEVLDPGTLPHFRSDLDDAGQLAITEAFQAKVRAADGLVIASPEYNYSVPGVLKNALDWCSRPAGSAPLARKPVAILGASMGVVGTARGQVHLRDTLYACGCWLLPPPEVLVGTAQTKFDAEGRLTDAATAEFVARHAQRFLRFVENVPSGV